MAFGEFVTRYGKPRAGSSANLRPLGLEDSSALRAFTDSVGAGVFGNGLISVASIREGNGGLFGWEWWLPGRARLFATSAFGTLFATDRESLWVVDTQYGLVVESTIGLADFLGLLAAEQITRQRLRAPLFAEWQQLGGDLPSHCVLCPLPALALGGSWQAQSLSIMTLPVYLTFTAGLFPSDIDTTIRVERVGDGQHT